MTAKKRFWPKPAKVPSAFEVAPATVDTKEFQRSEINRLRGQKTSDAKMKRALADRHGSPYCKAGVP